MPWQEVSTMPQREEFVGLGLKLMLATTRT